jgi:hypothetical protein
MYSYIHHNRLYIYVYIHTYAYIRTYIGCLFTRICYSYGGFYLSHRGDDISGSHCSLSFRKSDCMYTNIYICLIVCIQSDICIHACIHMYGGFYLSHRGDDNPGSHCCMSFRK